MGKGKGSSVQLFPQLLLYLSSSGEVILCLLSVDHKYFRTHNKAINLRVFSHTLVAGGVREWESPVYLPNCLLTYLSASLQAHLQLVGTCSGTLPVGWWLGWLEYSHRSQTLVWARAELGKNKKNIEWKKGWYRLKFEPQQDQRSLLWKKNYVHYI